ncbi:hypothetical protein CONCODRAFT_79920 [Conidiobolus coronatus NRRL 28638]|uniref:Transcription factor domain-containing protein n=1 Tax=Conidiobolus coronatus (strain ATCC 28846 / CBS 209.66 / NRRL 28638) TaxID=796925 RepID=A0A137NZA5_CONC2|nr:hypothetical protein CONCODRAFT_79920 [Conidiobolus coronatus NRRL 28638]|eukprot:KXN68097.1 hypothetical protein CONCODRAFT_79920 [Conidiobolus coronatus NRRL 28638]
MNKKDIITYESCGSCFKLIKSNRFYCKDCQSRACNSIESNSTVHKIRFSKNSKGLADVKNITHRYIESRYNSDSLNDKPSLSLIRYTHNVDNIHSYKWSNFRNIEQFGSFIIYSKEVSILDYVFRLSDDVQNIPRIQSFMKGHINAPKEIYNKSKPKLNPVIARPLLLILQEAFWSGLIESYFKYFHPFRPIFNLVNFNLKTASDSLLSAIYFGGFVTQPNTSDELNSYMKAYAITNIKKILFTVNLSSAQALCIYSHAYYISGNYSLSRVCIYHSGRMCHALGVNINRKNLSILDQYNMKLMYNIVKIYYNWVKFGVSPYGVTSNDIEFDLDIYEPEYHLPNSSLKLYNNDYESVAYSIFCSTFAKLSNFSVTINSKFGKYEVETLKKEIDTFCRIANEVYNDAKLTLEALISIAPEYKKQISGYLIMIKVTYIICILCIYTKKFDISENRSLNIIQDILESGIELYEIISNNIYIIDVWSWGLYIASFYLLHIYPHCTTNQKKTVAFILKSIINLYHKEGFNCKSTSFLILNTQFELIALK